MADACSEESVKSQNDANVSNGSQKSVKEEESSTNHSQKGWNNPWSPVQKCVPVNLREQLKGNVEYDDESLWKDLVCPTSTEESKENAGAFPKKNQKYRKPRHKDQERSSHRPNYLREAENLSPLRSPINPKESPQNQDNTAERSSKHRGSGYKRRERVSKSGSSSKPLREKRSEQTPEQQTSIPADDEEDTPITGSMSADSPVRISRSRRRLVLPSDQDECKAEKNIADDPFRIARREKDILYGKNTDAYRLYIETVPREERCKNIYIHPSTPVKLRECSRRSWDAQVKTWKKSIQQWARNFNEKIWQAKEDPNSEQSRETGEENKPETAVAEEKSNNCAPCVEEEKQVKEDIPDLDMAPENNDDAAVALDVVQDYEPDLGEEDDTMDRLEKNLVEVKDWASDQPLNEDSSQDVVDQFNKSVNLGEDETRG